MQPSQRVQRCAGEGVSRSAAFQQPVVQPRARHAPIVGLGAPGPPARSTLICLIAAGAGASCPLVAAPPPSAPPRAALPTAGCRAPVPIASMAASALSRVLAAPPKRAWARYIHREACPARLHATLHSPQQVDAMPASGQALRPAAALDLPCSTPAPLPPRPPLPSCARPDLERSPRLTKSCTSVVAACLGDFLAQKISHWDEKSWE